MNERKDLKKTMTSLNKLLAIITLNTADIVLLTGELAYSQGSINFEVLKKVREANKIIKKSLRNNYE
jgi:Icc-related predicted phosphoesterase